MAGFLERHTNVYVYVPNLIGKYFEMHWDEGSRQDASGMANAPALLRCALRCCAAASCRPEMPLSYAPPQRCLQDTPAWRSHSTPSTSRSATP
jgi:hypothetical protein